MPSLSHKIIRNTIYNSVGRFWGIVVGIFLTPYVVHHLGIERFGVWAIIGVVTGYFGLLDFGIGFSFVKYIAELYTKREYDNISNIVNTGFSLYALLAVVGTALITLVTGPLLNLFNIPPSLRYEAAVVLIMGVALFGASNAASPFGAIQGGLQRMDLSNKAGIALSVVNIAGTVFALEKGYGLIGLMLNNVVVFILSAAINIVIAFRILPELRFRPLGFDRTIFKRLFRFGCNTQVAKVSGMISNQTDKLFISCILSIGLVTFYQLGSSVVYYIASLAAILTSAIMPALSEIEARGERPRLIEAYVRSVKYLSVLCVPLFIFVVISAFQMIAIWMGPGYEKSGLIVQILALGWMMPTIAQVAVYVSFAIEKPQFMAVGSVIVVILNTILSFTLIKLFGFYGAAWGTAVAINIGTAYFVHRLNMYLQAPIKKLLSAMLPYMTVGAVAAAVVLCIDSFLGLCHFHPGRVQLLAILIARGIVFLTVYMLGVARFGLLDRVDIEILRERLPFGRNALKGQG